MLEFVSYIRLKYIEPDTPRAFVVPGGLAGAWIITFPKVVVIGCVLCAQEWAVWKLAIVFNVAITLIYVIWSKYHRCSRFSLSLPPAEEK